jgi:hypothetical protein
MRRSKRLSRAVVALLVPVLFVCFTAQSTVAAMVATERVVAASDGSGDARIRVATFLDRKDVQEVLERHDVDPAEAKARAAALTDAEAADLAARLDSMPAGGSSVGIIVGAILLVFFVLLITDLLGLTNIFPFINKNRH